MMNWENLKNMVCPYCEEALTIDVEIRCTKCVFHIEKGRFKSIVEHRGYPKENIVKLKWQNIRDHKCPVDGMDLMPDIERAFEVYKCTKSDCTFRIREDRMQQFLRDPEHPANRFYKSNDQRHTMQGL